MDKVVALSQAERSELFEVTAGNMGLPPAAVEKDFWVCWVLNKVFRNESLARQLLFKGGTSLSKCFGLIERFSEDIDLILDWTLIIDEDPNKDRSRNKQDMFNKRFNLAAIEYIRNDFLNDLNKVLKGVGKLLPGDEGKKELIFQYPKAFDSEYIRPEVLIEVSPMSAMVPNRDVNIQCYSAQHFPDQFGAIDIPVRTIEARKTFWDKITILHAEAHRSQDKTFPQRYSRHYYDTYQMLSTWVKDDAMADLPLLKEVAAFKHKFYPQSWAKYKKIFEDNSVQLMPQAHTNESLKNDYKSMQEMIHGNYPDFSGVMAAIQGFESELNKAMAN